MDLSEPELEVAQAIRAEKGKQMDDLVEKVARAIAEGLGDDFEHAFQDKSEWIGERGMRGGRFRDVNEPYQCDYIGAAETALAAIPRS